MSTTPDAARLRVSVEDLCDVLDRLRELQDHLVHLLREKGRAECDLDEVRLDRLRQEEEMILMEIIDQEKERLLVTEEVGDLLEHDKPVAIQVAEILPHLDGDLAASLSSYREALRDAATRLARQNTADRSLVEHSIDHIQIFLSERASENVEENGFPMAFDRGGADSGSGGDPRLG